MFVIAMISDKELVQTAFAGNANDAIKIAHEWYKKEKGMRYKNTYIVIDQRINGQEVNGRFAELRFDGSEQGEVKMFLNKDTTSPIFTSQLSEPTKRFLISFLEFSLKRLHEYIKNSPNR